MIGHGGEQTRRDYLTVINSSQLVVHRRDLIPNFEIHFPSETNRPHLTESLPILRLS